MAVYEFLVKKIAMTFEAIQVSIYFEPFFIRMKNESVDQQSNGIGKYWNELCQVNWTCGIELPIEVFPGRLALTLQCEAYRCQVIKYLSRMPTLIALVFLLVLDSNASTEVHPNSDSSESLFWQLIITYTPKYWDEMIKSNKLYFIHDV